MLILGLECPAPVLEYLRLQVWVLLQLLPVLLGLFKKDHISNRIHNLLSNILDILDFVLYVPFSQLLRHPVQQRLPLLPLFFLLLSCLQLLVLPVFNILLKDTIVEFLQALEKSSNGLVFLGK